MVLKLREGKGFEKRMMRYLRVKKQKLFTVVLILNLRFGFTILGKTLRVLRQSILRRRLVESEQKIRIRRRRRRRRRIFWNVNGIESVDEPLALGFGFGWSEIAVVVEREEEETEARRSR